MIIKEKYLSAKNRKAFIFFVARALLSPCASYLSDLSALFFENNMLAQDRIEFLDLDSLSCIAFVFERMIDVWTFCAAELYVDSLSCFLGHSRLTPLF